MTAKANILRRSAPAQLAVILACWYAGDRLAHFAGIPLPGSIMGMALLLILLATNVLSVSSLRRGTQILLADMLLFFVPAVPAVIEHPEFFGGLGIKLMAVIVVGTALVMAVTGLVVQWACK